MRRRWRDTESMKIRRKGDGAAGDLTARQGVEGGRGRGVMGNTEEKGKGSLRLGVEKTASGDLHMRGRGVEYKGMVRQTSGRQERKQEKGSGYCFFHSLSIFFLMN